MKKNIIKLSAIVFAASALAVSCEKNFEGEAPAEQTKQITFTAQMPETRTTFSEYDQELWWYPVLWQEGDKIHIFTDKSEAVNMSSDLSGYVSTAKISDGGKTAVFTQPESLEEATYYYAITPAACFDNYFNIFQKGAPEYDIKIKNAQNPLKDSCDPECQILFGYSGVVEEGAENVTLVFQHVSAYGKISFKNFDVKNDDINQIIIETSKTALVSSREGSWTTSGDYIYDRPGGSSAWNTYKVIYLNGLDDIKGREAFWFACWPCELEGETLTFTVKTTDGTTYVKTVTDHDLVFVEGYVSAITLDMSKGVVKQ